VSNLLHIITFRVVVKS